MLKHTPGLVKICGLNCPKAVNAAVCAGADYLGFVIYQKSPRYVSPEHAGFLAQMKGPAQSVAVLVEPDDILLSHILTKMCPDFIQLHGGETPQRCLDAKHYCEQGVWKALSVGTSDDLSQIDNYSPYVQGFVLDAKPADGADLPGGLGKKWDYSLLCRTQIKKPWLVAGGLTIETVRTALLKTGATGADVVSGVEIEPGVKDLEKINRFVKQVKNIH